MCVAGLGYRVFRTAPPDPPNLVLITIDTLRADALSPQETPAFEAFAKRGVRFLAARTGAPLTLPAHVTIFSGLAPCDHGIRDNTAAPLSPRAGRTFPLLAEEFTEAGYTTAAFVAAGVLHARYGIDSGFGTFRAPADPAPGDPRFPSLSGEEQAERFERFLAAREVAKHYFAWIHLWEPHEPYEAYAGDARRAATDESDPPAERYAGEVRRSDAILERLLAMVEGTNTIVIITSDHGESLGEHGEASHGYLCHGATMNVPLLMAGPGIPEGRTETRLCGLEDIAPTARSLCGLPPRPGQGHSLLSLPRERVLCGESLYGYRLYTWAQQSVATDGAFALVDGGLRLELFDLRSDPGEITPLADATAHPAYERLDRALAAYRARRPEASGGEESASPQSPYGSVRRAEGEFIRPVENRLLMDVRDRLSRTVPLLQGMTAAIASGDRALVRRLLDPLEVIEAEEPGNPAPSLLRGRALLLVLGDAAGAVGALEEAIRRGYRSPDLDRLLEAAREAAGKKPGR